jgi:hypothetical protein
MKKGKKLRNKIIGFIYMMKMWNDLVILHSKQIVYIKQHEFHRAVIGVYSLNYNFNH